MIRDNFEQFEVDKLTEAMRLLVRFDDRDSDAKHILQLLVDIKEQNEILTVVKKESPDD